MLTVNCCESLGNVFRNPVFFVPKGQRYFYHLDINHFYFESSPLIHRLRMTAALEVGVETSSTKYLMKVESKNEVIIITSADCQSLTIS